MSFRLDLSKFKKISSDKHSTLMRHEDGHELKLDHKTIEPKVRGMLAKMPAMAGGGKVAAQEEDHAGPAPDAGFSEEEVNQIRNHEKASPSAPSPTKFADGGDVQAEPPVDPQATPSPVQDPAATPMDPSLSEKRRLYNDIVERNSMSSSMGNYANPEGQFGPTGENPKQFDASAWKTAEDAYAQKQQANVVAGQQAYQKSIDDNKARASAGLAPNPVPPAPVGPGPNGTEPSLKPTPQIPQGAPNMSQGPQDPFGKEAGYSTYMKGLGEEKAGLFNEAKAQGDLGKQEAQVQNQAITNQISREADYQKHNQYLEDERQDFQRDIQSYHIDPQHYLNSKGTLDRISTGIGLILGGMGAGLTGGENQALAFLNKQIDRDIASQRDELGKRENLLSANFKQFGNMRDATNMTRVMQNDIVSAKLNKAAAEAKDPIAKARALEAVGKLNKESAAIVGQTAMFRTITAGARNGTVPPEMVIRGVVEPSQQKQYQDQLQDAKKMASIHDNLLKAYDEYAKENTVGNRLANPIQSKARLDAIVGATIPALSKETAGRYTESDAKSLGDIFKKIGADPKTVAANRQLLQRMMNEKQQYPMLNSIGIDTNRFNQYSNQTARPIPQGKPVK